jgi:hypothetical protein
MEKGNSVAREVLWIKKRKRKQEINFLPSLYTPQAVRDEALQCVQEGAPSSSFLESEGSILGSSLE